MILLLLGLLVGVGLGVLLLGALMDLLERPVFLRTNYRGAPISTSAGLVIV